MLQIISDRRLQRRHAPERTPSDPLLRDLAEEPLHLVQPRAARRREMQVVLGVAEEPPLHRRRIVRPVVVQDHADLDPGLAGQLRVQIVEEVEELLVAVPAVASANHLAGGYVQRREQRGHPVTDVVVRGPLTLAGRHRQQRPGAVQGLDLALLVDAQDDRPLRQAHVEPDDGADLLDEVGIGRLLEGFAPVRLQAEGPPDPPDRGLREALGLGHPAGAPVGGRLGLGFQRLGDDPLDVGVGDRAGGARPGLVGQPLRPPLDEPTPPGADGGRADTELEGDGLIVRPLGAGQDDLGAGGQSLSALGSRGPGLQGLPLVVGQDQFGHRSGHGSVSFRETLPVRWPKRKVSEWISNSGHWRTFLDKFGGI